MFLASGFEAFASTIADISAYMEADFACVKNGNICRETINFRSTKHKQSLVLNYNFKLHFIDILRLYSTSAEGL